MRHKKVTKREAVPDQIFQNKLVSKFINRIMKDGKKSVAQKQFYTMCKLLTLKNQNPMEVFEKALSLIAPKMEVKARRVGGASYQVPVEVRGDRRQSLAIRWIIEAAKKRSNREYHSFSEKLAAELLDAIENKGEAIKKRDTVLRMAEANRAFSHFKW